MQQIRLKIMQGMDSSEGKWELVGMDEFLMRYSPGLMTYVFSTKQFPPFHILNEELKSGGEGYVLSGICYWKPFELTVLDYKDLKEEMITSETHGLEYDENLEDRKTLKSWCSAVITHHNPRKREK